MARLRIINDFGRSSDSSLVARSHFILESITDNPWLPDISPILAVLRQAVGNYASGVTAAGSGDRQLIAIKNQLKAAVIHQLQQLGHYVLLAANGYRVIVQSSGLTPAKLREPKGEVGVPANVQLTHSNQPGQLMASCKKVSAAAAYLVQYAADAELKKESWSSTTSTSAKCLLKNLIPGTLYYVRMAAIGAKGQLMYSDVQRKFVW